MDHQTRTSALKRPYFLLLLTMLALLVGAVVALNVQLRQKVYGEQLDTLRIAARQQEMLLEQKVGNARHHVITLQNGMQRILATPELADTSLLARLPGSLPPDTPFDQLGSPLAQSLGTLYVHSGFWPHNRPAEAASLPARERLLLAATLQLGQLAGSAHAAHPELQWSYYYDAAQRYSLLYPGLSRKEVLDATASKDIDEALGIIYDAGGTLPVQLAGPQRNPQRQLQWTTPYMDSGGKGMMVSLLAPVYQGSDYAGAVGADITLSMLDRALQDNRLPLLQTMIIDQKGQLLGDSLGSLKGLSQPLQAAQLLPQWPQLQRQQPGGQFVSLGERYWLVLPIAGTPWQLYCHIGHAELDRVASDLLDNYLLFSLLGMLLLMLLVWLLHRFYTRPALGLADFVFAVDANPLQSAPDVPAFWTPWFERVARIASERSSYLGALQEHAEQLEEKVVERTRSLQQVNEELASALAELGETQERMVEGRKMAALGRLTSGMAHELNTPLGVALTAISSLLDDQNKLSQALAGNNISKSEVLRQLEQSQETNSLILRNIQRAIGLIQNLRQIGQAEDSELPQTIHFDTLLTELAGQYRSRLQEAGHTLAFSCPPGITVMSYRNVLWQVLERLIDNALVHGLRERQAGHITLTVTTTEHGIVLEFADNGRGLDEAELSRLFDPFYTSQFGQHHGLGTFMVYSSVTGLLQGRISASSRPGAGLRYRIELPASLTL
ncbi:ATP-binding protein [Chitinilyticum aquatile]|uniref:ATP-binding protein n=1 Tax=Chitinilyticum aquatile TaxID=362520 RepID=UPI0003F9DBC3|nr:ATP-binding protein [Chitinilyticum aquatile]